MVPKELKFIIPLSIIILFLLFFISVIRGSLFEHVEDEKHLFFEISLLLLMAMIAELAVIYLKQPSVALLLVIGIFLSPSFMQYAWPILDQNLPLIPEKIPQFITHKELIGILGQLGAIFILFKVGLHAKFTKIFNFENSVVAVLGIILPFAVGFLYALNTGGNLIYALFLGAALTATSVGITVALLKEYNLLKTKVAEVILGAAVIDDVLGLLVLVFVTLIASNSLNIASIGNVILNIIIFIGGGILTGKYLVRYLIDAYEMDTKNLLVVFSFAFAYAYIAEYVGLSGIVGAFIAGIILNESRHLQTIDEKTEVLELIFAPIFFISLGMMVDFPSLFKFASEIIIITVLAIISKLIACGLGSKLIGLNTIESLNVGLGMAPRGEVALIVGLIGITRGVLNPEEYTIIASMSFLTAVFVPFLMPFFLKRINDQRS